MNKKENARRILQFDCPERVVPSMPTHSISYLGCNHEGYDGIPDDDQPVGARWTDIWGIVWKKKQEGIMGYPTFHPLEDIGALAEYRWPDADDERIFGKIYSMYSKRKDMDNFLCGGHRNLLLEKVEKLIGMETLFAYFYEEPDFLKAVFHRYMDFQLGIARHYISLGVEMINCSEDLGTQNSLLINPDIFKEFLVPEYKRLFSLYKQHNVIIEFHSCGHIEPILEQLIGLGIDVLNPIQVTANNIENIRIITQGKVALHGGVNSDTVLKGNTDDITQEVRQRLHQLGKYGGYFCDVDQHMNFSHESIAALRSAVSNYGEYPLV